ncbi:MAG: polymorphic toxin-type HINT domain-containing protein [Capsulimonadales bacterium]|nr:polymorphic toxin-type HINT domain-containing protein [Capsulimonadales bacterium]
MASAPFAGNRVPAGRLAIGNAIVTRAGPKAAEQTSAVAKVEPLVGRIRVYNLNVADNHTFFVQDAQGKGQPKWVHNECDLGLLTGKSAKVTRKGLGVIEEHLAQLDHATYNDAMIGRLRSAMANGQKISGADLSFYTHELSEATMMQGGAYTDAAYNAAHAAPLAKYKVSPFSVYHPDVIRAMPQEFGPAWRRA